MSPLLQVSTLTLVAHFLILIAIALRVIMKRPATGVALAWLFMVATLPFVGAIP
jgi:cardiolipin synthase